MLMHKGVKMKCSLLNKIKRASKIGAVMAIGTLPLIGCSPKKPNPEDYGPKRFIYVGDKALIDYNLDGKIDAIGWGSNQIRLVGYYVESEEDSLRKYLAFTVNASPMTSEMRETANRLAESKRRLGYLVDERRYELNQER